MGHAQVQALLSTPAKLKVGFARERNAGFYRSVWCCADRPIFYRWAQREVGIAQGNGGRFFIFGRKRNCEAQLVVGAWIGGKRE